MTRRPTFPLLFSCVLLAGPALAATAPPTSNTAAATVQTIDVRSAGAKGDGMTNDTAAIQAALNRAASLHAAAYFPNGTYRAAELTYPPGLVALYGPPGGGAIIKRIDNAPNVTIQINANTPVDIENLTLDGNRANNHAASGGIHVHADYAVIRNVTIHDENLVNGYGWGISFDSTGKTLESDGSIISGNTIYDNGEIGISASGLIRNLVISNNIVRKNDKGGVSVHPAAKNETGDIENVTIANNVASANGGSGIACGTYVNFVAYPVQHCAVTGNVASGNSSYGIVFDADQSSMSGNVVDGNSLSTGLGGVLANASRSTITGNQITNNIGWGIDAGGARYLNISSNFFFNNIFRTGSGCAIDLNGNLGSVVSGNTFDENAGKSGIEISVNSFDNGGVWPVFATMGADNSIIGNKFILGPGGWGIFSSGGVTGLVVENNVFSGPMPDDHRMAIGAISPVVSGNRSAGEPEGASVVAASVVVVPEWSDVIRLTGPAASIHEFEGWSQAANAGKITYIAPGSPGSGYKVAPKVTISAGGGGHPGAATALLSGPAPASVGAYRITNQGSGLSAATATLSGGDGAGAKPGAVAVGFPTAMDGRTIVVMNTSKQTQTLVNGPRLALSEHRNCALTPNSTITFRVANGGIWYEMSRALQ